jgi:hypothetical protein
MARQSTFSDAPAPAKQNVATVGNRTEAVQSVFQVGQMVCLTFGQYADAGAIGMHGDNISEEVAKLSERYPAIAKVVDPLMQAGPLAGLVAAVIPLVLQIGVNHKRLPADKIPGITHPEVLEQQMRAQIAMAAAQQMRAAQDAEKEAHEAMADIQAAQNGSGSRTEDAGDK